MEPHLQTWYDIIEGMKTTNTYKLAWGKSLLDLIATSNKTEFTFQDISESMLKYYWNQVYFFKLKQGPLNQTPTLYKLVQEAIHHYEKRKGTNIPVWFNYAQEVLREDKKFYMSLIKRFSRTLNQDVSWRFKLLNENVMDLYTIQEAESFEDYKVIFKSEHLEILQTHGRLLGKFIFFKWSQLLENFNSSPRIANKLSGSEAQAIHRKSLRVYREVLLKLYETKPIRDFYTDDVLDPSDVSIDHFIPWSYMYSDDLWNLVITSKSNNARKSNKGVEKAYLEKLKQQNEQLMQILDDSPFKSHLEEALDYHYLDKFYQDFTL
jgi:hypothetical protein